MRPAVESRAQPGQLPLDDAAIQEIVSANARYRALLRNSPVALWRFELDEPVDVTLPEDTQIDLFYEHGYLAECNEAFVRMYGFDSADEIVGARLGDFLIRSDPANVEYLRAVVQSGYMLENAESVEQDKQGRTRHFLNSVMGVVEDGKLVGAWGTQQDVTEQKEYRRQIEEMNERLTRAVAESHHRIKNNLQVLAALVDIQSESAGEAAISALQRISQHTRSLACLHDVLTTEAQIGRAANQVSVKSLLEKVVPMMSIASGGRPVSLVAEDLRIPVKEASALCLLVNELVSNAMKHGSGRVTVRLGPNGAVGFAELAVEDEGPGFGPDFDSSSAANTGIDLAEAIASLDLNGELTFGNRSQGGACARVRFPTTFAEVVGPRPALPTNARLQSP